MKNNYLDLLSNAFPFMVLGLFLGAMTPVVPKLFIPEISDILLENVAPKSIMFLIILNALLTVILLRFSGRFDPDKKLAAFFYEKFSFKFNELGKSITAATVGTLIGLTLAMLPYGEFRMAGIGIYFSAMLLVIWRVFDFLNHLSRNEVDKAEKYIFYTVVILITLYYLYLIAKPV